MIVLLFKIRFLVKKGAIASPLLIDRLSIKKVRGDRIHTFDRSPIYKTVSHSSLMINVSWYVWEFKLCLSLS